MKKSFLFSVAILIITLFTITSCEKDIDDTKVTFEFTFNWDGIPISISDFNEMKYTNAHGEILSITRMRYLISNMKFINGLDSNEIKGYNLVDLTNSEGLTYSPENTIPIGVYNNISFTFGFDFDDNSNNYLDLNSVNWNWPGILGGGYHFMQYEGKFIDKSGLEQPYAYHMGTAKVSYDIFETNHFEATIAGVELLNENATIEIKMNIAEWFKNPNIWDLNEYSAPLMPNYDAQILMNGNGRSVFSLGKVTQ